MSPQNVLQSRHLLIPDPKGRTPLRTSPPSPTTWLGRHRLLTAADIVDLHLIVDTVLRPGSTRVSYLGPTEQSPARHVRITEAEPVAMDCDDADHFGVDICDQHLVLADRGETHRITIADALDALQAGRLGVLREDRELRR